MLLKIFGFMDLCAGIFLILSQFKIGHVIVLVFAFLLLSKGLIFLWDFNSITDVISSIVMVFSVFGYPSILTWIAAFWLLQKGFFSLFSSI